MTEALRDAIVNIDEHQVAALFAESRRRDLRVFLSTAVSSQLGLIKERLWLEMRIKDAIVFPYGIKTAQGRTLPHVVEAQSKMFGSYEEFVAWFDRQ